jgi:hypothetical protein
MNENTYNPENKPIRFINSDYDTLFFIPDGGSITITFANGEQLSLKCYYRDEYHVSVNNAIYNIGEFAEKIKRNGNTYEPCKDQKNSRR